MPAITFYKHEPIPMEMHKVKIVQQLHLLPTAQRLEKLCSPTKAPPATQVNPLAVSSLYSSISASS